MRQKLGGFGPWGGGRGDGPSVTPRDGAKLLAAWASVTPPQVERSRALSDCFPFLFLLLQFALRLVFYLR